MNRGNINRFCAVLPVVLSLAACATVVASVATDWGTKPGDEGGGAHLFHLLIGAQFPLVLMFVATANRKRAASVLRVLAFQAAAMGCAWAPVAIFRL